MIRRPHQFISYGLIGICLLLLAHAMTGCARPRRISNPPHKSEVIVMGMIHSGHRTNERYGIEEIKGFVRQINPDFILCEIPPDRFEAAMNQFRENGHITESRVQRFPEYTDAIFPLTKEMNFTMVPCAAWTAEMAADRRDKLKQWKSTRAEAYAEMERASDLSDQQLAAEGLDEDPLKIHTDRYDELTKQGLEPYNRLFNDDLGLGGWDNINAAHYALILAALEAPGRQGKRFLITFGAGHKHWFLEQLRQRDDIMLRELREFVGK